MVSVKTPLNVSHIMPTLPYTVNGNIKEKVSSEKKDSFHFFRQHFSTFRQSFSTLRQHFDSRLDFVGSNFAKCYGIIYNKTSFSALKQNPVKSTHIAIARKKEWPFFNVSSQCGIPAFVIDNPITKCDFSAYFSRHASQHVLFSAYFSRHASSSLML